MKILLLALIFTIAGWSAQAERFQGRSYQLVDGRNDKSKPAMVVVAMHGFLGTPRSMRKKTRLEALAARKGMVVLYPSGKRRRWNDGRSPSNPTDDVAYLSALIAKLVAEGTADQSRIFWAGHSNGGGMAMRMACDRPELVAGISVAATKSPTNYTCRNGRPIPAIFFHGTDDPIAPHTGRPEGSRLGATLSGPNTLKLWQSRNRCRNAGAPQVVDRKNDGTRANIIRYNNCRAKLAYILIEGHGHGWPTIGASATRLQGVATQEIDAATLSLQFFESL